MLCSMSLKDKKGKTLSQKGCNKIKGFFNISNTYISAHGISFALAHLPAVKEK